MKLTQEYHNNEPSEGNRSNQYFGLSLFLELSFFQVTRDTKFGKSRPDPRIFLFRRPLQEAMRRRVMRAAGKHGFSLDDAQKEWLWIIDKTTAAATKYINKKTDCGKSKTSPLLISEHKDLVESAFAYALRVAAGYVAEREEMKETWSIQPTLFFADNDSTWIYIRQDHPNSDIYKIGKTTRRAKRNSAYATHSAQSKEVASYPETEHVTEKKIHAYFAGKRYKREFFRLTLDDVATVCDPKRMRNAILSIAKQ